MKPRSHMNLQVPLQRLRNFELSHATAVVIVAGLLTFFYNHTFWQQVFDSYPTTMDNLPFLGSLAFCLFGVTALLLLLLDFPYTLKPWLTAILISASVTAYFMDTYRVIIDHNMIENAFLTDTKEVRELLNLKIFVLLFCFGILPSFMIWCVKIKHSDSIKEHLFSKIKVSGALLLVMCILLFSLSKTYASFLREHKVIRSFANPSYVVYSMAKFASTRLSTTNGSVEPLGEDAKSLATDKTRELIIMVVGESARADHFSLNGYPRETNPLLGKQKAISFTEMYSWGTSTASAVPCMFSTLDQKTYSAKKVRSSENLLDVLRHAKVNVLWRDNNSDSKGIATRVEYEDFKTGSHHAASEDETRDEEMLTGLQDYIDKHSTGDIFIVLHQMGNHGPAYYKRYPASFEKFRPVQKTNELGKCSKEEIDNAYDNAILYTDQFLSRTIDLCRQNSNKFETAMLYSSDHGESLGEQGIYLHGLPYFMAPEAQKHVATVFWFSDNFRINRKGLQNVSRLKLTHSCLFHTILGLMEIQTKVYDTKLDISKMAELANLPIANAP